MPIRRSFVNFGLVLVLAIGSIDVTEVDASVQRVPFASTYPAGTIVISNSQRKLYLVSGDGTALRYPLAIGMPGRAWVGPARIIAKYISPAWRPPEVVRRDKPQLPDLIPAGAPNNPLGDRAMALSVNEIAIHGTNRNTRKSIGTQASYGCIRMYNEDVDDLFDRVAVGTAVIAVP
jgi:lipoprotein-anchoring transpeptidase ErfK/SrfK